MPPTSQPGHICPECGKTYKAKETLTRHRKNHDPTPQYNCHLCSSSFRRRDLLSRHLATHETKDNGNLRTRATNNSACERCFQHKLRCDGASPCDKCSAASEQCIYASTAWTQTGVTDGVQSDDAQFSTTLGMVAPGTTGSWAPQSQDQQQTANMNSAWLGMDDLSLAEPMNIDSATSWPWLYEQMYMQNESAWPGYASSIPRLSSSPFSDRSGQSPNSRPIEPESMQQALAQDFSVQAATPYRMPRPGPPVDNSYPTPPSAAGGGATNFQTPSDRLPVHSPEPTIEDVPSVSEQREEVLERVVGKSLSFARNPSLGIWNKRHVSIEVCQFFEFATLNSDPSLILEHFVRLYFEHFYMLWPFLHRRTLQTIDRDSPYLYLTLSAIGAAFAGECAWPYHISLLNALREGLLASSFSESMPHHQLDYLVASLELLKISYMYFGHSRALSSTQMISGALFYLVRRMDLFATASLTGQIPFESKYRIGSRQWVRSENRKHLAIAMLMLENDVSILFGTRPLVSAEEFGISLPCPVDLWTAEDDSPSTKLEETEEEEQPLFSELVHLALDIDEPLPPLNPYQMAMIVHGFQAHVWRFSYEYGFSTQQRATAIVSQQSASRTITTTGITPPSDSSQSPPAPGRSMKMFWSGREQLIQALNRWRQVLVANTPSEKAPSQRFGLLVGHVMYHLSFMRLLAPLSAIHRLFLDTYQGNTKSFTLQIVSTWVQSEHAREALHHALTTRSLLYAELSRPKEQRARFNILPQFGLFHGAAILWALSGACRETGPTVYDAVSRREIQISQHTVHKILQSFAKLLHVIGLEWNGMSTLVSAVRDMAQVKFPREEQAESGG